MSGGFGPKMKQTNLVQTQADGGLAPFNAGNRVL